MRLSMSSRSAGERKECSGGGDEAGVECDMRVVEQV